MINTITQFLDTCYPFGYPLLICSLAMVTAVLYHMLFARGLRHLRLMRELLDTAKRRGSDQGLLEYAMTTGSALSREVVFVAEHRTDPELERIMESRLRLLVDSQRAGMSTISVINNIAPMLGILGTAWGLVDIFGVFGTNAADLGIAQGISKALYTTIFGLAIAVPGVICLSWFERSLEQRAARIDEFFTDYIAHRHLFKS